MDPYDALSVARRTVIGDLRLAQEALMALRRPERGVGEPLLHVVDDHLDRVVRSLSALLEKIEPSKID